MGTSVLVSEAEYLSSVYQPDCDWIDGRLEERYLGERPHSILQGEFHHYFRVRREQWGVRVFVEQRVRVQPRRYRVPDVCVYKAPAPREAIFSTPPWIIIEILSPEDRMNRVRQRIGDYLDFGVANVWVVDPDTRRADVYTREGMHEARDLLLATDNPEVRVPLAEIFGALDE